MDLVVISEPNLIERKLNLTQRRGKPRHRPDGERRPCHDDDDDDGGNDDDNDDDDLVGDGDDDDDDDVDNDAGDDYDVLGDDGVTVACCRHH